MPSYKSWIATTLLPHSAAVPGRLVEDITNPERHFQDTHLSLERPECPESVVSEMKAGPGLSGIRRSESNGLSLLLTALLGSTFKLRREEVTVVSADSYKTRTLSNSTSYFSAANKTALVRDWLEQVWRRKKKAYVVVGIMTVLNAKITIKVAKSREVGFQIKVPGSLALLAATQGTVPTLGGVEDLLDSEISTSHMNDGGLIKSFVMPGENIMAIQYRRVDFSWFRNPSSHSVSLRNELPWEVYLGGRGGEDIDKDSHDSIAEDDEDFVALSAALGEGVQPDDIGEFDEHEDYVVDHNDEVWHIY